MTKNVCLFVYGSLCEGMVHFNKLQNYVVSKKPARGKGSVYQLEVGYPVFLASGEDTIEGQILRLEGPETIFSLLDEFHGFSAAKPTKSLFQKLEIPAILESGEIEWVQIYALNPAKLPKNSIKIEKGEWQGVFDEKSLLPNQLTKKQASYIRRLGSTSGRDIVPIDLQLYRELMKLELIVDKGRRLALTKLGKEVYRYLP